MNTDLDVGSPQFQIFAVLEAQKWLDLLTDWVTLSHNLVVVHYEKLKLDQEREIRKIMQFFGIKENEKRLKCMKMMKFEWFRRNKKVMKKNPYSQAANTKLSEVIKTAQNLLEQYNHESLPLHLYPYYIT